MSPVVPFSALMSHLRSHDPEAARAVFDQFAQRLVRLAATRLPHVLTSKIDPDDVVQSVFRSFFVRHAAGQFSIDSWDSLWTLLTVLTVRKCGAKVEYFQSGRRDVRREKRQNPDQNASGSVSRLIDPEPSVAEALLLAETLEQILAGLKPEQRAIVQLRLEGCTIEEVSAQVGLTERTVHRVLEKVRATLEKAAATGNDGS